MSQQSEKPEHPGVFVRAHVIPTGMSVREAAKLLQIGRPALSNLVNARSSLSPNMAIKLEKTFGADRQKLLELQAAFDRHARFQKEKVIAARSYVPSFLTIKARQIHEWPEHNHEPRRLLAVLLRKLIHSTGHKLRHVDFPAYDNSERRGWDGRVDTDAATPWIPAGKSCWELGTNKRPGTKAESDYAERLASAPPDERANCTFVFVTPRNWPGKIQWADNKHATGDWKAVRAFDASDLEQWLEESISAQMWLAEQLGMPVNGFETLDQCWRRWEEASEPKMVPALFEPSLTAFHGIFKEWLEKPSERPFIVAADSRDEALAFLACLFRDITARSEDLIVPWEDLACVFTSADTLRTLSVSSSPFLPIVYTEEAERELATVYRRFHCIAVRPRNAVDSKPDIALELLNHGAFEKAFDAMGIQSEHAERLARESGRSPTILRRRLSKIDAIRKPQWAGEAEIARSLIPMALVGAWHAKSNADCEVVSTLSDRPYQKIEESVSGLLTFDDSPVWSAGEYRGVASKIDALFVINKHVTETNLASFLWLAEYVLSESDPTLDLPDDQQWAAGIYGKVRDHSAALRDGICETLVILSVHGNDLFKDRLGIDLESRVSTLIGGLLTPLSLDKLRSHDKDLPHYAEAAPDEFLKLLEADLQQPQPVVLGILRPAADSLFGRTSRTGLLWALECLAWQHLGRVNPILAQLSRVVIDDNLANKPIASLEAIYRPWLPQTAASLGDRVKALEMLTRKFPDIGWQICMDQLKTGTQVAFPSRRPRWRNDASGAGGPVKRGEFNNFTIKALNLALLWPKHDQKTLGDLIERIPGMSRQDQTSVWNLIDKWADSQPEGAKAELRERIRLFALTRRRQRRGLEDATRKCARAAYEKLQPRDPVARHSWLFAQHWVDPSDGEVEDERFDYAEHHEQTRKARAKAMKEIWANCGFEGVTALLSRSNAPDAVGNSLAQTIRPASMQADFLRQCLSVTGGLERQIEGCIQGFLTFLDSKALDTILSAVTGGMEPDRVVKFFRCAPFKQETWRLLERCDENVQSKYWQEIVPQWDRHSEAERIEIIDRLLEARRPRAAFHAVRLDWQQVETSRLKRLLFAVVTVKAEPADWYPLDAIDISEALHSLDKRTGVTPEEMAQLEFQFIMALEDSEHGIPNLEKQISESPILFVQALAFVFERNDDGQDPPEWRIEDSERRSNLGFVAYHLFERIACIPGTGQDGEINVDALQDWMNEVRRLCAEYGRLEVGEQRIGQLLSKAPAEEDGSWPCLPVCEAMESIASQQIGNGFHIGALNSRGVHSRKIDEGGVQERELAAKYRGWARLRAFDYPYVSTILEGIAADYDRQAGWEDDRVKIQRRLEH